MTIFHAVIFDIHSLLNLSTVDPTIPDTLGPERTVLIIEVSAFQGLRMFNVK